MYYYILNPSAGRGSIKSIQDKLRDRLDSLGIGGEFAKTTGPEDATKMAMSAITRGYKTIVAVGGDGTLNEVINGVTRDKIAIGVIPIGKNNSLARHLGVTDWRQACEVLAARRLTDYNLISAGDQFFLSELIIDADADQQKPSCRLRLDESYEVSSNFTRISVSNQKLEDPSLQNKLLIEVEDAPSKKSFLNKLLAKGADRAITYSRLKANRVYIDATPACTVTIDGKEWSSTPTSVKLTNRQVLFICEKQEVVSRHH